MSIKNVLALQDKRIRDTRIFCGVLLFIVLWQAWASSKVTKELTVHIPPRLERGAKMKAGEIPAPNIYSFSHYLFQKINTWEKDGSTEMEGILNDYQCYLTDSFSSELRELHSARTAKGETKGRSRAVRELTQKGFDRSKVYEVSNNKWVVKLDMLVKEKIDTVEIKSVSVRYPVIVIRDDTNPDCNPFGMKFAGYDSQPKRILAK